MGWAADKDNSEQRPPLNPTPRPKRARQQTILDAAVSAIAFYLVGWAFAYGSVTRGNGFIGDWAFALTDWWAWGEGVRTAFRDALAVGGSPPTGPAVTPLPLPCFTPPPFNRYNNDNPSGGKGRWAEWFFQWAFAATAATIPAGAVAERFNFNAYLAYSLLVSA